MGILTLAPALAFAFGAMSSRIYHTLEGMTFSYKTARIKKNT